MQNEFELEVENGRGEETRIILIVSISMFHRAFFISIIDKHQHMHFFIFDTILVCNVDLNVKIQ